MLALLTAWQVTANTLQHRTEQLATAQADNRTLAAAVANLKREGDARKQAVQAGLQAAQGRVDELTAIRRRMEVLARQKGVCAVPDDVRVTWEKL